MLEWFQSFGMSTAQPSGIFVPARETSFLRGGSPIRRGVNIMAQIDLNGTPQLSALTRYTGNGNRLAVSGRSLVAYLLLLLAQRRRLWASPGSSAAASSIWT